MLGKTRALLRGPKGDEVKHHVAYLKKTNPAEEAAEKVPDFKKFGRLTKLRLNLGLVPDLKWEYKVNTIHCTTNKTPNNDLRHVIKCQWDKHGCC